MNLTVRLTDCAYRNVRRAIVGALKDAIAQHGPITKAHDACSTTNRVIGMVWGALHNEAKAQQNTPERDERAQAPNGQGLYAERSFDKPNCSYSSAPNEGDSGQSGVLHSRSRSSALPAAISHGDVDMDKTLKAGTVVHVYGLPVRLQADVAVTTHDGTWGLIVDEHAQATDRSTPETQAVPPVPETRRGE